MTCLALVDGGGTKTRVQLVQIETQTVLGEVQVGPGHLGYGASTVWARIESALASFAETPDHLMVGLAGAEHDANRTAFIEQARLPTDLVSDRDSGLMGSHAGQPGACLTVGTGVALSWLTTAGEMARRGGFGFRLGDQGGGAWLGLTLLQRLLPKIDGGQWSADVQALLDTCQLTPRVSDWMVFAETASAADFAVYAQPISQCAKQGNRFASDLLDSGCDALCSLLTSVPKGLTVAPVGGLAEIYRPRLKDRGVPIVTPVGDALDGLRYLWHHRDQCPVERWTSYA